MRLHDYVNEIFDIKDRNRVDINTATSMFLTNCSRDENYYEGAESFDFATVDTNDMRKSMFAFYKAINATADEVVALREQGKRDEAKELVCNFN